MGEIGRDRHEYLYEMSYCDILLIQRGYDRRQRYLWSAVRWQTYHTMLSTCGSKSMNEAGIRLPTDLIRFPWEQEPPPHVSQEEIDTLQAEMAAINAANAQKNE